MGSVTRAGVHLAFFCLDVFALTYNSLYIATDGNPKYYWMSWESYGGKFKFLTYINKILQTLFFAAALLNDLVGSHVKPSDKGHKKTKLQSFCDTFYASLAFPVGVFVVATFWSIYAVDRELVYPKKLDGVIPGWMNHVMHTTVLPLLLIEKFMCFHQYPSKRKGLGILTGFALAYLLWILWVAYYADFWVYPILQVMEAHQRIIFITVLLAFFISLYILGEALSNFLWRGEMAILRQKNQSQRSGKQNGKSTKNKGKSEKQHGKPGKTSPKPKAN